MIVRSGLDMLAKLDTPPSFFEVTGVALEHAGYSLVAAGRLDLDDPADEGDAHDRET